MESDEEIRRVPEFAGEQVGGPSTSGRAPVSVSGSVAGREQAQSSGQASQRKRGKSPADKEHKRLKRYEICGII